MKTLIGINTLTSVDRLAYSNHLQLFYRLGVYKGRAAERGEDVEFVLFNPSRMSIDRMRNEAAKVALESELDYLWFIDDDVLLHMHGERNTYLDPFLTLTKADKDIIAGVTHIRGYPFYPMIFNFTHEDYKKNSYVVDYKEKADPETGLLECDAVGFSCCLIKVSLLKKMAPPFFITSDRQTEDVYFCKRAKEQVPEVSIFTQTRLWTAHILGSDIVDPGNLEFWKTFEESRIPNLKERHAEEQDKKTRRGDRDPKQLLEAIANF